MSPLPDRSTDHVVEEPRKHLVRSDGSALSGTDSSTSLRLSNQLAFAGSHDQSASAASAHGVRRRTRNRYVSVEEQMSERDWSIVRTVGSFRYLSTRQLEAMCFQGHSSPLTAARIARRVLERLTDLELLTRLERRIGGVRAGSSSYVYGLGPAGFRLLDGDAPRGRFKEPTLAFLTHTLSIAELAIQVRGATERVPDAQLTSLVTEPACWRSFSLGIEGQQTLKPDLFLELTGPEFVDRWFVEIDLGTESSTAIRKKAEIYVDYLRTSIEQKRHVVFPRVLWVSPKPKRVEQLKEVLNRVKGAPDELFLTALTTSAAQVLIGGAS